MKQSIVQGYTVLDNCFKYTNSDSTIDCYMFTRQALQNPIKTNDPELRTNSIYLLVGSENNKIKIYVGQAALGADGESVFRRMKQHLDRKAEVKEKYFPYWTHAIIFASKNTNPDDKWKTSDIDDLESILIKDTAPGCSWNSKNETIRNEISSERTRSHARKLFDIKEYIKDLQFNFFDEIKQHEINNNSSYEDKLAAEEKKLIDKTINLETINLEPNARVPEYTTPEKVVTDMLGMLPWETFDHTTTFFDPACKGGEFLALIHDRLMDILQNDIYFSKYTGRDKFVRIHHHIINNQLYGIAIGENSYKVAKERVYNCGHIIKASVSYIKNLKEYRKSNKDKLNDSEQDAITKEFNKEMKFDVVIGNPPYNDDDTKVATAIYSKFVEHGMKISNECTSFIIPSRWYASGRGLDSFRNMMLTEHKLKKLVDYEDAKKVFPTTQIAGGVCYFLADKNNNISCEVTTIDNNGNQKTLIRELDKYDVFIRDQKALGIVDKVTSKDDFKSLSIGVQSVDYFNVKDNFEVYAKKKDGMIEIDDASGTLYAYRYYLNDPYNLIDSYNVAVTHAVGSKDYVIPKTLHILEAGKACSVTYLCVGGTKNRENAEHLLKFIKTKFARFLLKQAISSINISSKSFSFVPIQDFNSLEYQTCNDEDKIDWSQSITNIDKQLYAKYNLTEDEIAYIESTIKSMDEDTKPQYTAQDAMANFVNKQLQNNSI